jgi:hypothetical protein
MDVGLRAARQISESPRSWTHPENRDADPVGGVTHRCHACLQVTDVGQIVTAMRALAADLVTERERVRSLLRENRDLSRENHELLVRLESIRLESTVCPRCGLPMYWAGVGQPENDHHSLA